MIDPNVKEAWSGFQKYGEIFGRIYSSAVFNAYLDAEAGRRMAEWQQYHVPDKACFGAPVRSGCPDFHHTWDLAQWREEIEAELNGS